MVVFGNSEKSYFHVPYLDNGDDVVDMVYERTETPDGDNSSTVHGLNTSEITFRGGKVQFIGGDS